MFPKVIALYLEASINGISVVLTLGAAHSDFPDFKEEKKDTQLTRNWRC